MHLFEIIEDLEKKIVEYYVLQDNKRYGWTVLQNIKTKVDYILNNHNEDEWSKEYYKLLGEKADELKINRKAKI